MKRMTKQKRIMHSSLKYFNNFFDVKEFHKYVNKSTDIGIATAYRFLSDLENKGEIHWYLCEGRKIYSKNKNNHIHFICEKCNAREHVKLDKIDFVSNFKNKVCHFQLDMFGTCNSCS